MNSAVESVQRLSRQQLVWLLENVGIQCYDSESIEVLREAVCSNLGDGTITSSDISDLV